MPESGDRGDGNGRSLPVCPGARGDRRHRGGRAADRHGVPDESEASHPSWVEPVNCAFSPTAEQVVFYTRVREAFAEGLARGTAAVPLDGKMVDVPVDEWAKVVLHLAALCQHRDEAKQRALQQAAAL
jgi:hypothetical protein